MVVCTTPQKVKNYVKYYLCLEIWLQTLQKFWKNFFFFFFAYNISLGLFDIDKQLKLCLVDFISFLWQFFIVKLANAHIAVLTFLNILIQ